MSNIKKTNKVHPRNESLTILNDIINHSIWLKRVIKCLPITEEELKEFQTVDRKYTKLVKYWLKKCEDDLKEHT